MDISAAAPKLVGTYDTPGLATGVQVVGSIVHVLDGSNGMLSLDVSTPLAIKLVAAYPLSGNAQYGQVVNGVAYVATGTGGLQMLRVNGGPTSSVSSYIHSDARVVRYVGNFAYVVNDGANVFADRGLYIYDLSNPAVPVQTAYFQTRGGRVRCGRRR